MIKIPNQYTKHLVSLPTINEEITKKIVSELCEYLDVEGIPQLAKKLNYTDVAIYQWIKRGTVPVKKLNKLFPELNTEFLLTGKGSITKKAESAKNEPGSTKYLSEKNDLNTTLNQVEDLVKKYEQQAAALKGRRLPPDAQLQLVLSAIKLLQTYIELHIPPDK